MHINRRLRALKPILFIILTLLVGACAPTKQANTSSKYSEDLSHLRPHYELKAVDTIKSSEATPSALVEFNPQYAVTDTLNAILDSISALSIQQIKYVDGYAVQVYSGNNRQSASIARGKAQSLMDDEIPPNMFYDAPNFKVQIGQYYSSLEANKTYAMLKSEFPNAILVLKKFKIERE